MATRHDRSNMLDMTVAQQRQSHPLDSPPFSLLDSPLEYFLADHLRQRALFALLTKFITDKKANREEADQVVAFLTHDLALHQNDEEEDLFPALRRRARSEDNLGAILAQLRADDRRSAPMIDSIVTALSKLSADDEIRLDRSAIEVMQAYTSNEHRHISIENAVVLVIAGVRLNRKDVMAISKNMKARRGVAG